MKKILPVGYEDIREIADRNLYYVDKSLMIRELLERGGKVNLFTRPRRFGKTLNLSMIRRFFELERNEEGIKTDNSYIFQDLGIARCQEICRDHQQKYPVIVLTMKSSRQPDFQMARDSLIDEIAKEYRRHAYVLNSPGLLEGEKKRFEAVLNRNAEKIEYAKSLEFLSYCLWKESGKKTIILLDEYDVPLENAYFEGFYQEMTGFMRSLLESALKTNPYLEFAVITGCLRISKESIFTGLNNLDIFSITSPDFADSFGFTEKEVREMTDYYGLEGKMPEIKEWYDGYSFGDEEIYNPWSIINYVKTAVRKYDAFPKPYWSNTSSNSIVRKLIQEADPATREEIEELLDGKAIRKPVHEDITYGDIEESQDNLWNFLFFTGYLKKIKEVYEEGNIYFWLAIPNEEIRYIYRNGVLTWFQQKASQTDIEPFIRDLEKGECESAGAFLSHQLLETISFYDYSESYYHGFLAGLLNVSEKYRVYSNREQGLGRPDIVLKTPGIRNGKAMILELKIAGTYEEMENRCREALDQIEKQQYASTLLEEGYQDIRKYGISFYKKECLIRERKD